MLEAAAGLVYGFRGNALAEAAAPPLGRGRYLAAYQYAFTLAGIVAPALVALCSLAVWLPWLLVAICATLATLALRVMAAHLPAYALRPGDQALSAA